MYKLYIYTPSRKLSRAVNMAVLIDLKRFDLMRAPTVLTFFTFKLLFANARFWKCCRVCRLYLLSKWLLFVFLYGLQVTCIPWNYEVLADETTQMVSQLIEINGHGVLTINSQPNVNGLPSTDPVHGWGNPGGYVYQKVMNCSCRWIYCVPQ